MFRNLISFIPCGRKGVPGHKLVGGIYKINKGELL